MTGHDGLARFPAQLVEVAFHALFAVMLYLGWRAAALPNRRFAGYVASYAAFRFWIETVRENPRIALGLSYYQWLCVPLFVLAAGMFVARSRGARGAAPAGNDVDLPSSSLD